jgi:hypothetical protein
MTRYVNKAQFLTWRPINKSGLKCRIASEDRENSDGFVVERLRLLVTARVRMMQKKEINERFNSNPGNCWESAS